MVQLLLIFIILNITSDISASGLLKIQAVYIKVKSIFWQGKIKIYFVIYFTTNVIQGSIDDFCVFSLLYSTQANFQWYRIINLSNFLSSGNKESDGFSFITCRLKEYTLQIYFHIHKREEGTTFYQIISKK